MAKQTEALNHGHYHCIECGMLFDAPIQDIRDQRCPVCGNPPTGKILAGTELDKSSPQVVRSGDPQASAPRALHGVDKNSQEIYEASLQAQNKKGRGRVKRTKRREKKNRKVLIMLAAWLLLMVVVVLLVKHFNQEDDSVVVANQADAERQKILDQADAKKNRMFVEAAATQCEKAMTSFLNAPSSAGMAQYVYQGVKLSGTMNRYYQMNPSFSSTRGKIRLLRGELLDFPSEKVIGTVCQNSLGERFEAIFIHENKEWKIDWKLLVRYDARPWSLFLSGKDGDEADFRLYMRVRDADEDLEQKEMIVVFYKPGMYFKSEFSGLASKSVRIPIESDQGQAVRDMLDSEEGMDKDAYGFTLAGLDPHGYHRVKVRIRLHKEEGKEPRMELVKILANHWYGIDIEPSAESGSESAE